MRISRRSDGRYQAQIQVDGVRRTVYGRTIDEVREKLKPLQRSRTQGKPHAIDPSGGKTMADLFRQWLATAPLKPRTKDNYRQIWRLYIEPAFGTTQLADLSTLDIETHVAALAAHGTRAPSHAFACMRRMLKLAVRWKWLRSSPLDGVEAPSYRPKQITPWTSEQLGAFLRATEGDAMHPLWVLLATTGVRMGEALALRWCDISLGSRVLHIEQTIYRGRNGWILSEPKTEAGRRPIHLGAMCVKALERLHAQRGDSEFVFATVDGRPYFAPDVVKAFHRARKQAGLPHLTPHGLRHTHASILIDQRVPLPQISRRLGHANTHITAQIYSHALGEGAWIADLTDEILSMPPRPPADAR